MNQHSKVSAPNNILALVFAEIVLIFSCYILATYWTLPSATDVFLFVGGGLLHIGFVVAVIVIGLYLNDLYESFRIRSRILLIQQFCFVLGIAFLTQAILNYGQWGIAAVPKWTMLYGSLMVVLVLPPWRMLFSNAALTALGAQRVLFLGSSPLVQEIIQLMNEQVDCGMTPIGYLDQADAPMSLSGAPLLGSLEQLERIASDLAPNRIVIGLASSDPRLPVDLLIDLQSSNTLVEDAQTTYEATFRRVSVADLPPARLILSSEFEPRNLILTLQALYSLVIGFAATVVTLPLMAVVALTVKMGSPGPVLLRLKRVGLDGRLFTSFKFRAPGSWLERTGLDRLPELFNVLKGDMAIVGPRAERPEFATRLRGKIPFYNQRQIIKPGLTGWAQINRNLSHSPEDPLLELEYDLYYIKNLALFLDSYILLHSFKRLLMGGAS